MSADDDAHERPRTRFFSALARRLAGKSVDLEPERLLEEACARAGLHDFGDTAFRPGLEAVVRSADDDGLLHLPGRAALRETLLASLTSRLRLVDELRRHARSDEEPLRRPLFIAGLPRTGTTLLHRLLCLDERALHLPLWLCLEPFPPPAEDEWRGGGERRARAAALVEAAERRDPELAAIHRMRPDLPEECTHLFRSSLETWQLFLTSPLVSYQRWYLSRGQTAPYRHFRQALAALERGLPGDGWVLKAPQHWGCLRELREVFPEATIVCTHRDPGEVVGSWCSLIEHLWQQRSTRVTPALVGETQLDLLARTTERALAAREARPGAFLDVPFKELVSDPMGVVRHLYARTDRHLNEAAEARMMAWLEDNPRHKHGAHVYALESFGLDRRRVDARFEAYRQTLQTL